MPVNVKLYLRWIFMKTVTENWETAIIGFYEEKNC